MLGGLSRTSSRPYLPWSGPLPPELLELPFVAQRVHALPEAFVLIGGKLAVARQVLEHVDLEARHVSADVVEHRRLAHHEPAVDPALPDLRFLREFRHEWSFEDQATEPRGRSDRRDRRERSTGSMEGQKVVQVHVADTVAVGQHEAFVAQPPP